MHKCDTPILNDKRRSTAPNPSGAERRSVACCSKVQTFEVRGTLCQARGSTLCISQVLQSLGLAKERFKRDLLEGPFLSDPKKPKHAGIPSVCYHKLMIQDSSVAENSQVQRKGQPPPFPPECLDQMSTCISNRSNTSTLFAVIPSPGIAEAN